MKKSLFQKKIICGWYPRLRKLVRQLAPDPNAPPDVFACAVPIRPDYRGAILPLDLMGLRRPRRTITCSNGARAEFDINDPITSLSMDLEGGFTATRCPSHLHVSLPYDGDTDLYRDYF